MRRSEIVHRWFTRFACYRRDSRASATVELVLTLPLFILFILVTVEVALYYFVSSSVQQGAFAYSRQLADAQRTGRVTAHRDAIRAEILQFFDRRLIKTMNFEIGPVTETTDFTRPLTGDAVRNFIGNRTGAYYLRVVVQRQSVSYGVFKPVWDVISDPQKGGMFSKIDVFVVIPWPPKDNS